MPHPWRHSKPGWTRPWAIWSSRQHPCLWWGVELDELWGHFQPKSFCNSMILTVCTTIWPGARRRQDDKYSLVSSTQCQKERQWAKVEIQETSIEIQLSSFLLHFFLLPVRMLKHWKRPRQVNRGSILRDGQNLTRRGHKKPAPDAFSKQGQSLEVHFSLNYSAILWFINAVLGDAFSFSLLKQMQLDPPQLWKKWENIHIRKCSEQDTIVYIRKQNELYLGTA